MERSAMRDNRSRISLRSIRATVCEPGRRPVSLSLRADEKGILPDRLIATLVKTGAVIPAGALDEDQIQPASVDLRLGEIAYRVRASFLPGPDSTVGERIDELKLHEISLGDGAVLETGCVYIVPLMESLCLPPGIGASASSIPKLPTFLTAFRSASISSASAPTNSSATAPSAIPALSTWIAAPATTSGNSGSPSGHGTTAA